MQPYVTINGLHVGIIANMTVLQICGLVGIYVPRFCYHEKLSIVGSCRMCLVEMDKVLKPIIACATPVSNGMTIHTETALVKNSREHILEFLLINHPLDCPICDQGGECDLQDQALIYGSDRGRFKEKKRTLLDKDFGPFIKTMMTRCIHCTRCIRFMSEIASNVMIGTFGRGVDMEVGTYVSMILHSEISGNIIDICPVGALTSKPFAFASRSWELRSTESIDILDGLGSSIRLDFRGSEIVRILPCTNELINEQWITDKIRFTYDGFKYRRLTTPLLKKKKLYTLMENEYLYISVSWEYILQLLVMVFIYYFITSNGDSISFSIGELIDFKVIFLVSKLFGLFGLSHVNYGSILSTNFNIDIRENYVLNRPIVHFEHSGLYLFLGSNLQLESPLLNIRLFKQMHGLTTKKLFGFFGSFLKNLSMGYQLGISTFNMLRLIEGRHTFCKMISGCNDTLWVTNIYHVYQRQNLFTILNLISKISNKMHYYSTLHLDCTLVGILDLGVISKYKNLTNYISISNSYRFIYNIGNIPLASDNITDCVIYQGTHSLIQNLNKIYIFLPSTTFIEKTEPYINTEGRLLFTKMAVVSPGLSKKDAEILNIFISLILFQDLKYVNHSILYMNAPYLYITHTWCLNTLYCFIWYLAYTISINVFHILYMYNIYNTIYIYNIDNYYNTNIINLASKFLAKMIVLLNNYVANL